MKTEVLPISSPEALRSALFILHQGGLVAFPTDTVYGLGALAFNGAAVEALYTAKKRPGDKAIPVLLGSAEDLPKVASSIPVMALTLAARFWPGPLTLVIPKHPDLPKAVSDSATVGVRVPGYAAARVILQAAGPMAVTSANLSGEPSPTTPEEVLRQLGGCIPLILDGGRTHGGIPSTVVDCLGGEPRILREGPLSSLEIFQALGLR